MAFREFSLPLPSLFKWVGWAVCANFQVCNGVISWRSHKLYTATDSEFPLILQKHTTRYNRLILCQAILTARTSHSIVSGYTWHWISRGQPARQNEVQSRQVCKTQGDSCKRLCSRTWPPIGTEVSSWYCRTANITCFLSSPVERWTELKETCWRCTSKHKQKRCTSKHP